MNIIGISTHLYAIEILDGYKLKNLKEAGFNLIELYANIPHLNYLSTKTVKELASNITDLGLEINSIHSPFYENLDELFKGNWLSISATDEKLRKLSVDLVKRSIAMIEYINFDCAVIHLTAPGEDKALNNEKACMKSLEELLPFSVSSGIKLAIENIPSTLGKSTNVVKTVKTLNSPEVGICFDSGHSNLEDNIGISLELLKDHIITTHLHDNDGNKDEHLPPEEGNIDWLSLFERMKKFNYKGPFIFEPDYHNSEESLKKLSALKKKWETDDSL